MCVCIIIDNYDNRSRCIYYYRQTDAYAEITRSCDRRIVYDVREIFFVPSTDSLPLNCPAVASTTTVITNYGARVGINLKNK